MTYELPFDTVLTDGTPVTLRRVTPDDRARLRDGFDHLSDASRYMRYLGVHPTLSDREIDGLTGNNEWRGLTVGAVAADTPAGIARLIPLPQTDSAEIALTITDAFQHRGLGKIFMNVLVEHARNQDFRTLHALVHPDNAGMLSLLKHHNAHSAGEDDGYEREMKIDIKNRHAA